MFPITHLHPKTFRQIFRLNPDFDSELLKDVPVVKDLISLLRILADAGEARATQNGNLPVKIVNKLYIKQMGNNRPFLRKIQSEEYVPDILSLRVNAINCGWIKKRKNKFSLTKKGEVILKNGITRSNYLYLINHFMFKFNWSYPDGWDHCKIIQQAVVFELYILHNKARDSLDEREFANLFLKAFPFAPEEVDDEYCNDEQKPRVLAGYLESRFLKRFCEQFGLIKIDPKYEYDDDYGIINNFKTTKLFNDLFLWFS